MIESNLKVTINQNKEEHLQLIQVELSGGKTLVKDLEFIKAYPNAKEITISGLEQDIFDYFLANYGEQFKKINFWKCPKVSNLKAIEKLEKLEALTYFWNQKATELWDLSKNKSLKSLELYDFTKLKSLYEISLAKTLEELSFGDKIDKKTLLESLEPIGKCLSLKKLSFVLKKLENHDITPLANLINLEELYFPLNLFTTEEIAWLKAQLPNNITSTVLAPYKKLETPIVINNEKKDTFIIGKRKPFLSWEQDSEKIKKYETDFNNLVLKYSKNRNSYF